MSRISLIAAGAQDVDSIARLHLWCVERNHVARRFYDRQGGTVVEAANRPVAQELSVPELWVDPAAMVPDRSGDWYGRWEPRIELDNPFPFPVKVVVELRVRRGGFEVEGLPVGAMLQGGGRLVHSFRLTGGSW